MKNKGRIKIDSVDYIIIKDYDDFKVFLKDNSNLVAIKSYKTKQTVILDRELLLLF